MVGGIKLRASLAQAPCSWERLELCCGDSPLHASTLAFLPLHALIQVRGLFRLPGWW